MTELTYNFCHVTYLVHGLNSLNAFSRNAINSIAFFLSVCLNIDKKFDNFQRNFHDKNLVILSLLA